MDNRDRHYGITCSMMFKTIYHSFSLGKCWGDSSIKNIPIGCSLVSNFMRLNVVTVPVRLNVSKIML